MTHRKKSTAATNNSVVRKWKRVVCMYILLETMNRMVTLNPRNNEWRMHVDDNSNKNNKWNVFYYQTHKICIVIKHRMVLRFFFSLFSVKWDRVCFTLCDSIVIISAFVCNWWSILILMLFNFFLSSWDMHIIFIFYQTLFVLYVYVSLFLPLTNKPHLAAVV